MFHLDYISCCLSVLATILVGRKSWTGLLVSIVNCLIVCVIGLQTSQFGLIPANLFCVCVYAFSIRSWRVAKRQASKNILATEDLVQNENARLVREAGILISRISSGTL